MEQLLKELTPFAMAVALSPIPIVALLLMLLSKKAKLNSVAFLIGWASGLAIFIFVVSFLISSATSSSGTHPVRALMNGALGILLIIFALNEWRGRPRKKEKPHMPKWMLAINSFSPVKAFGIGLLLSTLNFKNTPMGIAAASILSRQVYLGEKLELLAYYVFIGSVTIIFPVFAFIVFGKKLQKVLSFTKEWLVYHNNVIMFILFIVLGAVLLWKAFGV